MEHFVEFPGLGLEFTLNTIAFEIFGFAVYWYGIIIALGFVLAVGYGLSRTKYMNIKKDDLYDMVIAGMVLGVVGARLYYVIFYPGDKYINNPLEIFDIRDGGLGIYGGIIGGLLGAAIVARIKKLSMLPILDIGVLGFLIGQGIGRWANFVNQEAFGDATDLPWGMISDATVLPGTSTPVTVHPCFLYESILCLLGFVLLHFFNAKMRRYDGQTFLLYVIWYGISRFFIEGLRTDSLYVPGIGIKVSQAVALLSVAIAIALLVVFRNRTKLTGAGNADIMVLNNVVLGSAEASSKKENKEEEAPTESTLFKGKEYMYNPADDESDDEEASDKTEELGEDESDE